MSTETKFKVRSIPDNRFYKKRTHIGRKRLLQQFSLQGLKK